MIINEYAKRWCEEDYDIRKEDFYIKNAYWIELRNWTKGALKHIAIPILVFIGSFALCAAENGTLNGLYNGLINSGIMTIAFWFYGIRKYDANCDLTDKTAYVTTAVALFLTRNRLPVWFNWIFAVATLALFVYISIVRPIRYFITKKEIKRKIAEEEKEKDDASKQSYGKWQEGYKAFRYGLPEGNVSNDDPKLKEAKDLFEGYTSDKQTLKTRYRQLAKKHHPDMGGDEDLFKCIIQIYEELNAQFVA